MSSVCVDADTMPSDINFVQKSALDAERKDPLDEFFCTNEFVGCGPEHEGIFRLLATLLRFYTQVGVFLQELRERRWDRVPASLGHRHALHQPLRLQGADREVHSGHDGGNQHRRHRHDGAGRRQVGLLATPQLREINSQFRGTNTSGEQWLKTKGCQ